MIVALALTLATGATPCLAPPTHHKHHVLAPVQSCIVQPAVMCYRDVVPEPDMLEIPSPLIYYTLSPPADVVSDELDTVPAVNGDTYTVLNGGLVGLVGPASVISTTTGIKPDCGCEVRGTSPERAPEISGAGGPVALTLLIGLLAVINGRKRK